VLDWREIAGGQRGEQLGFVEAGQDDELEQPGVDDGLLIGRCAERLEDLARGRAVVDVGRRAGLQHRPELDPDSGVRQVASQAMGEHITNSAIGGVRHALRLRIAEGTTAISR